MDLNGQNNRQITRSSKSESNARWLDNNTILFLSGGKLCKMDATGSEAEEIKGTDRPVSEFSLSPKRDRILFISNVKSGIKPTDRYPDLDKASGRIINDLMYRHWDCFVEEIPHSFLASFNGKSLDNVTDILEGLPYDLPTLPFGGIGELCWSPTDQNRLFMPETHRSSICSIHQYRYLPVRCGHRRGRKPECRDDGIRYGPCFLTVRKIPGMVQHGTGRLRSRQKPPDALLIEDKSIKDLTANFKYNISSASWKTGGRVFILPRVPRELPMFLS
jgi:hypothetical protein